MKKILVIRYPEPLGKEPKAELFDMVKHSSLKDDYHVIVISERTRSIIEFEIVIEKPNMPIPEYDMIIERAQENNLKQE